MSFEVLGQENLLFNRIQAAKDKDIKFENIGDFFISTTELNQDLILQFKNQEDVDFIKIKDKERSSFGDAIEMTLPLKSECLILQLLRVSDSFYDYKVKLSDGREMNSNNKIEHFRGVVEGQPNSIVALSVFNNEVLGIVSTTHGNFNISYDKNSDTHLYYNEKNLNNQLNFKCGNSEDAASFSRYSPEVLSQVSKIAINSAEKCVRLYLETEYDVLQARGNVASVELFVSSIFNQVATLYENENIGVSISDIFVWTSADPYTGNNTTSLLTQFQSARTSFDGDLGQLLTFRDVGGGRAAEINGLCNSLVSKKLSVSGINNTFSNVPAYSWTVAVVTHEFGHLLGSRHTHACVWNGNNTAIDGCVSPENLACSRPGVPSAGGTIMSYCHFDDVGINFSLGFGPQPGNVIRNSVANATCLCDCVNSSISGPNILCSSTNFNLLNPPTGNSILWSVSPSNMFTGSTSGNGSTANLNPNSASRGLAILTFTVVTSCGNVEIKKPMWVGKASVQILGPYEFQFNTVQNFSTEGTYPYAIQYPLMGISNYQWSVFPSGYEWIGGNGSSGISLSISNPDEYSLGLSVTNPCGVIGSEIAISVYDLWSMFLIYPNPASGILNISKKATISSKQIETTPFEISLHDSRGQQIIAPRPVHEQVEIDVSNLENGFYFIHILYKGKTIKKQIKVER
ncbi:zinc-dependent metalloprotease [Algoriphagus sp. D3-2-R+10]|uniref:zinc-dependent metalloprotease n=1 Tax=Algoriphagus aurantiacus TaxID=3103948 RepID=UPI002B3FBB33|nr:zinc-dependent metalloprotease [Algoriphagus sp. D3-2-R+10]MEB2778108.1 zinc-dependent metalloprotease [Algoriphagus sp. D3-2-R+10]